LCTYVELEGYLADFVAGHYSFLWVVGRPGISKTESILAATSGRKVYYRKGGQLTPLQFYIDCFQHLGLPIILDDAEHLLDERLGRKLVSTLGDTTPAKLMSYGSTSRILRQSAVPDQYSTTSPLCILSNVTDADAAIRSRAVTLYFEPTNAEIHRAVAQWFWDQDIHDWVGRHVSRLRPIDMRLYVHASADKRAGRDWARILLDGHTLNRAACVVQDLEHDPAHPESEDKARRYTEVLAGAKGASRASYFRIRARLKKAGQLSVAGGIGPIPLVRTRPPGVPGEVELESLAAPAVEAEEPAVAAGVSAREAFARPVQGQPEPGTRRPGQHAPLDDRVPWERDDPDGPDEE
jgi:hypothetical protein